MKIPYPKRLEAEIIISFGVHVDTIEMPATVGICSYCTPIVNEIASISKIFL